MASDFSSPFVVAQIVTQDGEKYPFWTNLSGDDQKRPATKVTELQAMTWLQEVNIEMNLSEMPKLSVTLAPPFREGMAFINSPLIYYGVSTLEVQFGYVYGADGKIESSPVFRGTLWTPEVNIAPGDVQISLNAHGGIAGSDLISSEGARVAGLTGKGGNRKANFQETRAQLIDRVINETDPPRNWSIEWDPSDWAAKDDKMTSWAQGGLTDWQALKILAKGARCDVQVDTENKVFKFISISKILAAAPKKAFRLYDFPGGVLGSEGASTQAGGMVYPIFSISSPPSHVFAPAAMHAMVMNELSEKDPRGSKGASPTLITEAETSDKALSAKGKLLDKGETNTAVNKDTGTGGERYPGDPELNEAYKFCKGEYEKHANMGVRFDVGSIGIPDLFPGDVIKMDVGIHRISAQSWYVHTVKHSVGLGGFDTNFTVVSNVDSMVKGGFEGLNEGEPVKGEPNDRPVEAGTGTTKEAKAG